MRASKQKATSIQEDEQELDRLSQLLYFIQGAYRIGVEKITRKKAMGVAHDQAVFIDVDVIAMEQTKMELS